MRGRKDDVTARADIPPGGASPAVAADRKNARVALSVLGVATLMLGMSFAAVPLYRMFCQVTGFAGTPVVAKAASATKGKRTLSVRFDANMSPELDWSFAPEQTSVEARTGETKTIFYKITNRSDKTVTAMATYNVTPDQAGGYFNKISCFCFTDKTLGPGESMELPVVFFLDPALESDETMQRVDSVTLSYTFVRPKGKKTAAVSGAETPASPAKKGL
ncbi:MAG: cytochrome c oxidase assembly protein [Beijerinckiaceae bacterium]